MAPKVLVDHWLKQEWIAAFILALAWFASQTLKYIKGKQQTDKTTGRGTTTMTHHHHQPPVGIAALTPPAGSSAFHNGDVDDLTQPTTVVHHSEHAANTPHSNTKFTMDRIGNTSSVLMFGFITLAAGAAFSGTTGYNSRTLVALGKATRLPI